MAEKTIKLLLVGEDKSASKALKGVGDETEKAGGKLGGMKIAAGVAMAGAAAAIVDFATGSVEKFAQLEDATAAAGTIFGANMTAIQKQADGAAQSLGMTKTQVIAAANTFGAFGKGAGLAGSDLSGFSIEMTQLAGDMASFRGTSPEQAIQAIGAAFRGESEPIRAYGVMLDDASMKAEAMRLGLVKTSVDSDKVSIAQKRAEVAQRNYNEAVKEHGENSKEALSASAALAAAQGVLEKATAGVKEPLTQQQKLLATQSLVLRQTSDAQGDYARTSDSTANTQKTLLAEVANLQAELGEKLAPALVGVQQGILGFIDGMKTAGAWIQDNQSWLVPLSATVAVLAGGYAAMAIAQAASNAQSAIAAAGGIVNFIKAWAAEQAILNLVMSMNPIALVVIAIAALVAGLVVAYNTSEDFRRIVDGALQWVKSSAQGVAEWFSGPFVSFFTDAGQRIGDFFMVDVPGFFTKSAEAIGAAFSGVKDLILAPIRSAVQWINDTFVSGINGFLGTIGISWRVPTIPGFADGGYTGAGGKYQPAGIVHAGEVVWSQDDVAAWGGPQAVDSMRRARSAAFGFTGDAYQLGPGYAGGGIVGNFSGYDPGALAAMKAWAGATGRTWTQTGKGGARTYAEQWQLYLNHLAGGNLAADPRKGLGPHMVPAIAMDLSPRPGENAAAKALLGNFGLGLTVPGEPWHIAKLGGRGGGVTAGGAVDFGIGAIIDGLLSKLPGLTEPWGDVLKTIVGKVPEALIDKVMGLFGFDDGGYMMPGMVGVNRTGSPEPVFTSEQWDILKANVGGGASVAALREALDGLGVRITGAGVLADEVMGRLELSVARRI